MKIEKFEDIIAWQKAKEAAVLIYALFKNNRDYGYKDQIQRAAISMGNNIAEGYERRSNREFKQFLYIAKGSCAEVRSMLLVGLELDYFSKTEQMKCYNLCIEISKMLSGLIKTL